MKRPFSRLGVGFALWCGAAAATGCAPSNKVKSGQPVLLSFSVVGPDGQTAALKDDMGMAVPGPALATFFAVFDRLLDPTVLEDAPDAGMAEPKGGVSTIETDLPAAATIASKIVYVPNGDTKFTLALPPGPSITVSVDPKKAEKGLPNDATVTVTLNPDAVRSHDKTQQFMAAADADYPLSYKTVPFGVAIDVPQPSDNGDGGMTPPDPVDATFVANVVFNNLTDAATKDLITASATVAGAPVADLGAVVAAGDSPNAFTVSPATAAGWPAGAVVTITVAGTAANLYMQPLGAAAIDSFTVKP